MPSPIGGVYTLADNAFENPALDSPVAPRAAEAVDAVLPRADEDPNAFAAARVAAAFADDATAGTLALRIEQFVTRVNEFTDGVVDSDMVDTVVGAGRGADATPAQIQSYQKTAQSASTREDVAEAKIKQQFAERFANLAKDEAAFHALMKEVYGENYDAEMAEGLRQAALKGDFSWLPDIEFVSDTTLQGANGAYDGSRNVVYINERFINSTGFAAQIYMEEAGHCLDTKLNDVDTAGDEGEMFRRVAMGESLSEVEKAAIQDENDQGTIVVDGKEVAVEFWNPLKSIYEGAKKAVEAVGTVAGAVVDAAVGTIKNSLEAVADVGRGVVDIFKGNVWEGIKKIALAPFKFAFQTPADAILLIGGKTISAVQTLIGVETEGRKLNANEIEALRKVYGDSIDYDKVTVKEGDVGLLGVGDRTRTVGNTIYVAKGNLPLTPELLTHEMAHVWQFQNGGSDYMGEAIWAQALGDGYDWEKGISEGKSWDELNPEQQAELIEQAYRAGFFNGTGKSFIYNGTDYTDYLTEALKQVRAGDGAP